MESTVEEMKDHSLIMKIMYKAVEKTIAKGFDGKIDYERVAKELAASAYRSSIMLELSGGDAIYADYTPEQFYCRAAEAARKFAAMVEKYRDGIA